MQTGIRAIEGREIDNISPISRTSVISGGRDLSRYLSPRKAIATVKSNRPHSLAKREFYNELCVQLKQGSFDVRNNFVAHLYKCLKNHPDYENDLVLNSDMSVNEVVSLIKNKIYDLVPSDYETIIEIDRYQQAPISIVSHKVIDMPCNQQSMPLVWLLELKRRNHKLYTIVKNVISLVKGKYRICGPFDGFAENAEEYYMEGLVDIDDEEEFKESSIGYFEHLTKNQIDYFKRVFNSKLLDKVPSKDGSGYLLMEEIEKSYKEIDQNLLMNQINTYNPRNETYKSLLNWAKKGMRLLDTHHDVTLSDLVFVSEEEYDCGEPITAMDFMKFEWNFRCSYWSNGIEMWLNEHAGQFGIIEPRRYSLLQHDHYVNHLDDKYELFGFDLNEWFDMGTTLYYGDMWEWK